jgi:TonB family protein
MPYWMRVLGMAGMLCLPLAQGVCQDDPRNSLTHYRLGEAYLQQDNLQTAANEFREALNGDLNPAWTEVWSHIQLGRIFDVTSQHDRALNEYRQARKTGDNTDGALDLVNNYLKLTDQAVYLPSAPSPGLPICEPIQKTDPEYTEEARLAELEGSVLLHGVIGQDGFAHDLQVIGPLGLGLDEKAIEAVKQWHFQPVACQGGPNRMAAEIAVDFRLTTKQSRWHLIQVQFDTPKGTTRPVFVSAVYPIGAALGPEAMEEGRLVVAMGRLATAKLTFEVDQYGIPSNFQIPNASEAVWGSEATAVVGQWRFMPGTRNGIAVAVPCTVELVWGERELSASNLAQVRETLKTAETEP